MISHLHRFIFIHIPKCAGTTIEKTWSDGKDIFDWNHQSQGDDESPLPLGPLRGKNLARTINLHDGYFLFTFVRNPWTRAVSTYLHSRRGTTPYFARTKAINTFSEYLRCLHQFIVERNDPGLSKFDKYHSKRQVDFFPGHRARFFGERMKPGAGVEFVGRIESFEDDFERLRIRLGIEKRAVRAENRNPDPIDWRAYYDPETTELVRRIYAEDIEYLEYDVPE